MRKVYQTEKSATGLAMAVLIGVGISAALFAIIPFSHLVAKPRSLVQLTTAKTIEAPPKVDNEPPPPAPEPEKKEEAPPELKLVDAPQQIVISTEFESVGGKGAAFGLSDIRQMTQDTKDDKKEFSIEELDKKPEAVSRVDPAYPAALRKQKVEGIVTLIFVLTEEGRVEDARVETSSRPEFEKPALDAIRKWRFRPGMKEGQAVRAFVRQPLRFRVPGAG